MELLVVVEPAAEDIEAAVIRPSRRILAVSTVGMTDIIAPGAGGLYSSLKTHFTAPGCDENSLTRIATKLRPGQWTWNAPKD